MHISSNTITARWLAINHRIIIALLIITSSGGLVTKYDKELLMRVHLSAIGGTVKPLNKGHVGILSRYHIIVTVLFLETRF